MKTCSTCKESKPYEDFYRENRKRNPSRDGYNYQCKKCCQTYARERYHSDEIYRLAANASRFRRVYGITIDEFIEMRDSQGNTCAICHGPQSSDRALSVDHNHETGLVRALLCDNCNRAIGLLQEDPERARTLADYLEKWS